MAEHEPSELDLTPATSAAEPEAVRAPRRKWRNRLIVAVFVGALSLLLFQALTSARVFFYNVDEAVADRAELADRTFRLQGTVVDEPIEDASGALVFTVGYNGVQATVRHVGEEPTDLFEVGIPVVAEGRWDGDTFESQQLLVKHSEAYVADNDDRPGVGEGNYEDGLYGNDGTQEGGTQEDGTQEDSTQEDSTE